AAALYCAGLITQQALGSALSPGSGLSFADLPALLAVVAAAVGIVMLTTAEKEGQGSGRAAQAGDGANPLDSAPAPVLPGLADGYVVAVALLVIGWVTLFSAEFHRSAERPGTFLLALIHPLADLAVLGALLPMVTTAWRRVMLPYLALLAVLVGDALAVGQRALGGHPGVATQLLTLVAAVLLGAAPWRVAEASWTRRASSSAAAATIVAALTAAVATIVVIANGLAGAPASGAALVVAGGAGVLVLAVRVFMLVNQNGIILGNWRESSRSLRELASRTSDVVLVCDPDGVISYASPAVGDYGYAPGDLTGRRLLDFVHPEDRGAVRTASRRALGPAEAPASAGRFPARVRAADGTWRHVESTVLRYQVPGAALAGGSGGVVPPGRHSQIMVTARDVSDQVALRQQVAHLTFHDGLTGLPNRAYVEERTRDVLRDATPTSRIGVIFLDLDRFTAVNDSVGHGAGDLVLAQAARRLRATVPVHDTVARWGSDEFAVLVENAAGAAEVSEIGERLVGAIAAEPFRVASQQIALTASVGVALTGRDPGTPDHPDDPAGLVLRNAGVAMSRAKEAGGDRAEVYAAHMHADVVRRLEIVADLQRAISNGELTLQYQPIVELATSRVVGAEALVRWWRDGEVVTPREFLGAAEESGLIVPLGEWVLRQACAQGAAWRRASWDVGVAVNLSVRQITAPGFTARVAAILAETGLPSTALTVEVNERILVEKDGLIADRLAELHQMGVRMAIDDFGIGYASLAYLRQLPLDIIKIDPSFVAGLGHDDTLTLLTRTVVQVGRELGLRVIAEGIEQPRQVSALREMGCDYGQGFLVARPMAAPGVEALIRTAGIRTSGEASGQPGQHEPTQHEPTEHEPNEPARLGM
ncbi:MAG TPA: sensor domain-containing phosphodiesterase, partial [Streptosporangiaceae bacterium]|nr:sensor domain-containing phosphodiesterase [Streptosporangiaceae bacterium]